MANELWWNGLLVTFIIVLYWRMWHQRALSAKKGYLLISLIGFLMGFGFNAVSSLPEPLAQLVWGTSAAGVILAVVFMYKYYESLHPKE